LPEGDSIFRAARTLNRALAGHQVVSFESVFPALTRVDEDHPLRGRTIESVTAAGKHMLVRFSGDLVLRTHMRMNGSWHVYRRGERWQRPRRDMRIVIATDTFEAVGFNVPVAEFLDRTSMARQDDLRLMGPDLLGDSFDEGEAIRRFREHGKTEIAVALLNQRIVAGAGNIYKSEVLFLCHVNPFVPVAAVDEETLRDILRVAQKYMRVNVTDPRGGIVTYRGYRRTTGRADAAERLYVYGRARQPCRKCGTPIRVKAQGRDARLTYWCPTCQPSRS
jgi:endonuclease VIII